MKRPGQPAEFATAYVMLADPLSKLRLGRTHRGDWRQTDALMRRSPAVRCRQPRSHAGGYGTKGPFRSVWPSKR